MIHRKNKFLRIRRTPVGMHSGAGMWDPDLHFLFNESDQLGGLSSTAWSGMIRAQFGHYRDNFGSLPDYGHSARLREILKRFAKLDFTTQRILEVWYTHLTLHPSSESVKEAHRSFVGTGDKKETKMTHAFDVDKEKIRLVKMAREDYQSRRDRNDPMFSIDDLAHMSGISRQTMAVMLVSANVKGVTEKFTNRKIIPLSHLLKLAKELKWLKFLK